MFFSSPKTDQRRTLVVHLDDDAFHVSVVEFGDTPRVEWYEKKALGKPHAHGDIGLKELRELLVRAAARYPHVSEIAAILGAPHAFLQVRELSKRFSPAAVITEKVFADLVALDRKHVEEQVLAPREGRLEVVSRTLAHIRVNGYPTAMLFGKKAETVEFRMVMGYVGAHTYRTIDALFSELFPHAKAAWHVRELLLAQEFLAIPENKDALFLGVRRDSSHIALFQGGLLAEHVTCPVGIRTIVEHAVHALGASHAQFASLMATHKRGDLSPDESRRFLAALARGQQGWFSEIAREWAPVRDGYHLPRKLVLFAAPEAAFLLGEAVRSARFRELMRKEGDFEVVELSGIPSGEVPFAESYLLSGLGRVMHSPQASH